MRVRASSVNPVDVFIAAGALRTVSGSYTLAFFSAGALCVIASLIVLPIGKRRLNVAQPTAA